MGFLALLPAIGSVISEVLGKTVGNKEERDKLEFEIQKALMNKEGELTRAARDVIVAEAQGESWLQRNWRPIVMLVCMAYVGAYLFGFTAGYIDPMVAQELFNLVQIGVGGYIAGRSVEKTAKIITETSVGDKARNALDRFRSR